MKKRKWGSFSAVDFIFRIVCSFIVSLWAALASAQGILGALNCQPTPGVQEALSKAQQLSKDCQGPGGQGGQKMAVTDYSSSPVQMWVFDQSGKCLKAHQSITWGSNSGAAPPKPGCSNGSHMTPAGAHCTAVAPQGAKYGPDTALLMKPLEGQGSDARAILIHSNKGSSNSPSTWGCTGCNFEEVQRDLGVGSVLYNWFGGEVGDCSGVGTTRTAGSAPAAGSRGPANSGSASSNNGRN